MPTDLPRQSPALRRVVAARAQGKCEYCQTPEQFATQSYSLDHILPRAAGGATILENLAWACLGCNAYKHIQTHAVDPVTYERIALYHPRRQTWGEHFTWNAEGTHLIGKTACGRATVDALRLNRSGLINLRRVLVAAKLFLLGDS
ncbi:MAG: HNH endonuclease [Chloroflexi bacterium]|nr:HNH endonuclease [Chloroflexota bacterium]